MVRFFHGISTVERAADEDIRAPGFLGHALADRASKRKSTLYFCEVARRGFGLARSRRVSDDSLRP